MGSEEYLDIVDKNGMVIGRAPRSKIHGNPELIHRVVHVLVFNKKGELLLQKRPITKDVAPGKWDTSVGGHVESGEDIIISCKRELQEELGIKGHEFEYLYSYIHKNNYEAELVYTFRYIYDGEILFNKEEIDEIRFWNFCEIKDMIGKGVFSDNFEDEFMKYLNYCNLKEYL